MRRSLLGVIGVAMLYVTTIRATPTLLWSANHERGSEVEWDPTLRRRGVRQRLRRCSTVQGGCPLGQVFAATHDRRSLRTGVVGRQDVQMERIATAP